MNLGFVRKKLNLDLWKYFQEDEHRLWKYPQGVEGEFGVGPSGLVGGWGWGVNPIQFILFEKESKKNHIFLAIIDL